MGESPYGHDHPVLDALADWVKATDPYTAPLAPEEITDEMRLALVLATRNLNSALVDLVPYSSSQELRELGYSTRHHMRDLSMQFLVNEYTDSNTDETCDVEWNVTGLVMLKHPPYERPDEIRPAYVGYLIDKGPEDDQ
jgi:hypothetical protein